LRLAALICVWQCAFGPARFKKKASEYAKIVEWSDEDQCFIGRCPELFHGGTHGDSEAAVHSALCDIVEETLGETVERRAQR
jgi:predicted RNase H-like HicB family nuclease